MNNLTILDIDGVLNPFYARSNSDLSHTEHDMDNISVFLLPDLKDYLLKISKSSTVVWGSAWGENSNLILQILGIDEHWGHIPLSTSDVGLGTWKLKSVKRWFDSEKKHWDKVVWADDELEADAINWIQGGFDSLVLAPERYTGLVDSDFKDIIAFLNK